MWQKRRPIGRWHSSVGFLASEISPNDRLVLALIFFVIVWPYLFFVVGVRLQLQKSRKALTAHHEAIDGYLRGIASSATYTAPGHQ